MKLQESINAYLRRKGITQRSLAERTGMTTNALNLTLKGNRKLTADEYIKICITLEVLCDFFVPKK